MDWDSVLEHTKVDELTNWKIRSVKPKVTIMVATYNRPDMLLELVESVLCQTFSDWELLIMDDCSPTYDLAFENVRRIADERIRFFVSRVNVGFPFAVNWFIRHGYVRGDYVAYSDDDDLFYPNKLMAQVEYLNNNKDTWMVYSDIVQTHDGKIINLWGAPGVHGQAYWNKGLYLIGGNNWIQPLRVMHRASDELWDSKPSAIDSDYRYFKKMAMRGFRFDYWPIVVGEYRWHGNNRSLWGYKHDEIK